MDARTQTQVDRLRACCDEESLLELATCDHVRLILHMLEPYELKQALRMIAALDECLKKGWPR